MRRIAIAITAVLAVGATGLFTAWRLSGPAYTLQLVMPTADQAFVGGAVTIDGERAGKVRGLKVRDGQAVVTVEVDDKFAPLHAGTVARINWESLLGARIVDLVPGPKSNPAIPSGHLVTDAVERVELDDVMAMLDAPTRKKVSDLLASLQQTTNGSESDINTTLREAGPAVEALGGVLRGIGSDGPAIKSLVRELASVTDTVAARRDRLASSIRSLDALTSRVGQERTALQKTLSQLPSTLDTATQTLGDVPGPVDRTRTLLRDLRPFADRLPNMAANLSPVLTDLRAAAADLGPTLDGAAQLLTITPGLFDVAHQTFPDISATLKQAGPMIAFLRPYTPELIGWLSNWTSVFASQNGAGNYARALITVSASSLTANPGVALPGLSQAVSPAPGEIVGQSWTDANGDGPR